MKRASDGGGSTALSSCEMYLGGSGGTSLQKTCGFEDSTENMIAYIVTLRAKVMAKIKLYAENAADHFEWIKSLGVSYKASFGKNSCPRVNESLLYTGNERVAPFCTLAKPIPRGHVPSHDGDFGGKIFFDALKKKINSSNIQVSYDSRVNGLVINNDKEIIGVSFKKDNNIRFAKAKKGVILTAGGFVMNEKWFHHIFHFRALLLHLWKSMG